MGDEEFDGATEKTFWPPKAELERWLMNSAKDLDKGAGFLRRMLHMNPAYGSYLVGDEDLASIVQLSAKKFRNKIIGQERLLRDDPSAKMLYEPMCEGFWRVIGHLLHCICDLDDTEGDFPVPKEPLGQVKMLLHTNQALSNKLNENRRAYLRELSAHRDRQRELTDRAKAALEVLEEQPVMFYEPLEFVLDEATKQFVREVVEERLKLDYSHKVKPVETKKVETSDIDVQDTSKMSSEMAKMRAALEREKANAERAMAEAQKMRSQVEQMEDKMKKMEQEIGDLKGQVESLTKQRNELNKKVQAAEAAIAEAVKSGGGTVQVIEKEVIKEVIVEKFVESPSNEKKAAAPVKEAVDNSGEMQKLQQRIDELEQLLEEEREKPPRVKKEKEEKEPKGPKVKVKTETKIETKVKVKTEVQTEIKEVVKIEQDPALQLELERCLQVEKELRAANKALEKALEESKLKPKYQGPKGETRNVDEEIAEAMATATEQHKKRLKDLNSEIYNLKQQLEEALAALERSKKPKKEKEEEEEPVKKEKKPKTETVMDTSEADKWKAKFKELKELYDALLAEHDDLEDKVRMLIEKVQKYGGKEAVAEIMKEIKIKMPKEKGKKKEKAFERLYRDALRRIEKVRQEAEELAQKQKVVIFKATEYVKDRKSLNQIVHITHLQKAAEATQDRFNDAVANFHSGLEALPEGMEDSGTSGAEDMEDMMHGGHGGRGGRGGRCACGRDAWVPEIIAMEVSNLRERNQALEQELARLRILVPATSGIVANSASMQGLLRKAEEGLQRRAETGKKPGQRTELPVFSSQPIFGPRKISEKKGEVSPGRGRREFPSTRSRSPSSSEERSRQLLQPGIGISASAPSLPSSWRPMGADAVAAAQRPGSGDGNSLGLMPQRPRVHTPPTGSLMSDMGHPIQIRSACSPAGSSSSLGRPVSSSSLPVGDGGLVGLRPQSSSGPLDSIFTVSSTASTSLGPPGSRGSEEWSMEPLQVSSLPTSPQRPATVPATVGGEKGPKRRLRGKEDGASNAPVKARPSGMCVTALRSQEHLSALPAVL